MEHLGFKRSVSGPRHNSSSSSSSSNNSHKSMRQNLDRIENTVTAIPQTLGEYMDAFNSLCISGIKFASLLETLFQDTPILMIALRFREACERLNDKCYKSTVILKGEIIPPVTKKMAPSLSRLRDTINSHAKSHSKYESYAKQLDTLGAAQSPNKQKLEQVEAKFQASAKDFAARDSQLAEATNDMNKMRVEVMGSCFLSFLETQSKLLLSASDLMAPLGAYKEVGKGLNDAFSNSAIKEATVGWLAAAQVNQNLRSFGSLTRNDVQCMMYNHRDGLPSTIKTGLNTKVDLLIKKYEIELKQAPHLHHKVTGGFHLNPKGIELALRDCCSELEGVGAGAPHALTKAEKDDQITRDVPRTSFRIMGEEFGCAMGENVEGNIREKLQAIAKLTHSLHSQLDNEKVQDFALHVLNESCTTVTNTAAKTAVQLVFGKANLVLVRPSPSSEDNQAIEISPRPVDGSVTITVQSSWWLVEDYAAFAILSRTIDPSAALGVVDVVYTISLKFENFIKECSSEELPSIAVTCRQVAEKEVNHHNQEDPDPGPSRDSSRLHTLNRTLKGFLNARHRPHTMGNSNPRQRSNHHDHQGGQDRSGTSMEQETATISANDFSSGNLDKNVYRRHHSYDDNEEREDTSSGSSPLSDGERRTGEMEEEEEEEGEKVRQVLSDKENDMLMELNMNRSHSSNSGGGGGGSYSHSQIRNYGRSDSFGRGLKPSYSYQMKRYPSNDSMSSQSTLVAKLSSYDNEESSLADILGGVGEQGLTLSNINDHLKSEARKDKHGRHYQKPHSHHHHHHRHRGGGGGGGGGGSGRGEDVFSYGGKEKEEEFRKEEKERTRETERRGGEENDISNEDPLSPAHNVAPPTASSEESLSLAPDAIVQNVIDFLSRTEKYTGEDDDDDDDDDDRGHDNRNHSNQDKEGYSHSSRKYNSAPPVDYQEREWHRGGGGGSQRDGDTRTNDRPVGQQGGDNSSSGSSGVSTDNGYRLLPGDTMSSRSVSMSPGMEGGKGHEDGRRGSGGGGGDNMKGSFDSGINLHSHSQKKKSREHVIKRESSVGPPSQPPPGTMLARNSQDLPLDFSKGFGSLISSDQVQMSDNSYSNDPMSKNSDYPFTLDFLSRMNDGSDSERSGRDSIPLVSSSSSEAPSPLIFRTTSSENLNPDRPASQNSTHSMSFSNHGLSSYGSNSQPDDIFSPHHLPPSMSFPNHNHGSSSQPDDLFNHAPGSSRLPHHNSSRSQPFSSNFEYEDRLSQHSYDGGGGHGLYDGGRGNYDGGRGSRSQGSNDWGWGGGVDSRSRPHGPYDNYGGPPSSRGGGGYDSPVSHSQEMKSRSMQRQSRGRVHEDYNQPPPPFMDRRGNPPGGAPPLHRSLHGPPGGSNHHGGPMAPPPRAPPGSYPGPPMLHGPPGGGGPMSGPPHGGMSGPPHGPPGGGGPMSGPPHGPPGGMPGPPHGPPGGMSGPLPHGGGGPMSGPPHGPLGGGGPMHRPPPPGGVPPPNHHGGPGHSWFDPSFEPPHMRGGGGPPLGPPPGPPHHPVHDNRFRPVPFGGRSNTPSDAPSPASMHSMSPGPSPRATPPPTPPPNMVISHHVPPIPGGGGPPPHMGHPGSHHMPLPRPRPPPPWEGGPPNPRDFGPLPPPGPHGLGHAPSSGPLPPMTMHSGGGGGVRYPNHIPEWERNNWQHH